MMRMIAWFLILMLAFGNSTSLGLNSTTANDTAFTEVVNCIDFGNVTKKFHIGWPYEVDCSDLLYKVWQEADFHENAECALYSMNGTLLWNVSATLMDFLYNFLHSVKVDVKEHNSSYLMRAQIPGTNRCGERKIMLRGELSNGNNYSCRTLPKDDDLAIDMREFGDNILKSCSTDSGAEIGIFANDEDLSYEWWHNCSNKLPANVQRSQQEPRDIVITNATYANAGTYTCAVLYKGQVRFLQQEPICLRAPFINILTMKCPDEISAKEGYDLNVTCHADRGLGNHGFIEPKVSWYNNTNSSNYVICSGHTSEDNVTFQNEQFACENFHSHVTLNGKCFQYEPPADVDTTDKAHYRLTLLIKNFQQWDVGNYTIQFETDNDLKKRHTIKISMNYSESKKYRSIKIGIGAIIAVILILLCVLCWLRRMDVLWFAKKYLGPYEKADMTYDVAFLYHFSRENMSRESGDMTHKIVESLLEFFHKIGTKVFDENRKMDELQLRVQNIAQTQKDCHCVVVVLNEEFFSDDWSLHKIYTAFKNMIEGGAKMIFIVLPGMTKKLQLIPNEARVAVKQAMAMGTTIKWSGELPFTGRFKRRLEYELPKTRSSDQNELVPENRLMQTTV